MIYQSLGLGYCGLGRGLLLSETFSRSYVRPHFRSFTQAWQTCVSELPLPLGHTLFQRLGCCPIGFSSFFLDFHLRLALPLWLGKPEWVGWLFSSVTTWFQRLGCDCVSPTSSSSLSSSTYRFLHDPTHGTSHVRLFTLLPPFLLFLFPSLFFTCLASHLYFHIWKFQVQMFLFFRTQVLSLCFCALGASFFVFGHTLTICRSA